MKSGQLCNKPPIHFLFSSKFVPKLKIAQAIYGFWVVSPKECNGDVHIGFCATLVNKVWNLNHVHLIFCWQHFNFRAFELLSIHSCQILFHVNSNSSSSSSSSQPKHIVICHMAGLHQLLHLPKCQVHRHCFVPGITALLSWLLNACYVLMIMPC